MTGRTALRPEVEYPTGDGKPLAETERHFDAITEYAVHVLRDHFAASKDVHVAGNNFIYYRQGDPRSVVSPDCYVVKGVAGKEPRDSFKVWEENGCTPCFVLEVTSRKTRREDRTTKRRKYRQALRVPEYFLFDPRQEWLGTRLVGLRLVDGRYRAITPDARGRFASRMLGLELAVVGEHLRFFEPGSPDPIPTRSERADAATRARGQALVELKRARAATTRAVARAARAEQALARARRELRRR